MTKHQNDLHGTNEKGTSGGGFATERPNRVKQDFVLAETVRKSPFQSPKFAKRCTRYEDDPEGTLPREGTKRRGFVCSPARPCRAENVIGFCSSLHSTTFLCSPPEQ